MSDSRGVPSADPSPEMVRHHLAATAQRELDALRAELDARLSALEAALAHPDPRTSLEDLVLNLARVATAEAESAAARASLEAQLDAQERAAISVAEAQRALEAERAISHALRVELDQAATALERQREAAGRLRQDVGAVGKSLEAERETRAESVRELERIQDTLQLARDADVARWRQIQQLEVALESERARGAALDAELAAQRDAMVQLSGIRDALQRNLAAAQRAAESRVVDDAGYRAALDTLERRCAELEQHGTAAVAHASEAVRARDALAATLEAERQAASVARVEVDARAGELDSERANADEKWRNAEARATKAMGERDALGHALETERHQTAAALAAAEAHVTKIEAAQANAERSRKDAEVRADEASAERDTLATLLESANKSAQGVNAAVEMRLAAIGTKLTRSVKAWEEAEARAQAAIHERDALAAELEAARQAASPDLDLTQRLEAATERIRVLEIRLFERDRGPADREVELGSLLSPTPARPSDQAGKRARRHTFRAGTKVRVDREPGLLVDLSVTGAQVICAKPPDVGSIVTMTLLSDEAPCFCQGRLLWARREQTAKGRPFRYPAGIVFTAVDEAAIEAFIHRHAVSP